MVYVQFLLNFGYSDFYVENILDCLFAPNIYSFYCLICYFRPGVTAAKAAEMEVIAVPSLPKQSHLYTAADEVINSLLDLQLEKWGLPSFADCKS